MKYVNRKIGIISILIILVLVLLLANIFIIVITKEHTKSKTDLSAYIENNQVNQVLTADRGSIYTSDDVLIATDMTTYNIICYLDESRVTGSKIYYVQDKVKTAQVLAENLDMEYEDVYNYLTLDKYQTELGIKGRNLTNLQKEAIEEAIIENDLTGIAFEESSKRFYPKDIFASYVVGFAQLNDEGVMTGYKGVEAKYNDYLQGTDGFASYQCDKNGYILDGMEENIEEAVNGNNLYLTIDERLQSALQNAFDITSETFNVDYAWGAVMEAKTGKVLAWGQSPSYNPNTRIIENSNNLGSQYAYEPGSVMKPFLYASAIDTGVYDGSALIDSSPFYYIQGTEDEIIRVTSDETKRSPISNAYNNSWGMISYDDGLIRSSNVATACLMSEVITPGIYSDYLEKFGFFQPVDTDIPEVTGYKHFDDASEKLSLGYGQGSSVTTLQLLQAYSAIFTDGTMKKPYFVDKVVDSYDGSVVLQNTPEISEPVISEDSAKTLQKILAEVVSSDHGTARHYQMDEVNLLAKTGTSQVIVDGKYDDSKMISSVMIALPAEDPEYMFYYAYYADSVYAAHQYNDAEMLVLENIVAEYNLKKQQEDEESIVSTEVIQEFTMPELVNHSLDYVEAKMANQNAELIVLGDSDSVIAQLPNKDEKYFSYSKVFLLTNYDDIKMPNMLGWTRAEIIDFWNITGIQVSINGTGTCVSQSILADTVLSKEDIIEVTLE